MCGQFRLDECIGDGLGQSQIYRLITDMNPLRRANRAGVIFVAVDS